MLLVKYFVNLLNIIFVVDIINKMIKNYIKLNQKYIQYCNDKNIFINISFDRLMCINNNFLLVKILLGKYNLCYY